MTTRTLLRLFTLFTLATSGAYSQVIISEFMADNATSAIVDDDGDHSDWIELTNMGNTPVTLNGWYLTDEGGENASRLNADLRKWQFPVASPVITLAATGNVNSRLVVWCSNKNRKANVGTPTAPRLHTNFKLDASGEHLALVRADGVTVEHEIGSAPTFKYPPQPPNRTYGTTVASTAVVVIPEGSTGKYKVPTQASDIPAGWNALAFDDSTWTSATSGIGYGFTQNVTINSVSVPLITTNISAAMAGANKSAFMRFPFTVANPSGATAVRIKLRVDDGYVAYLNGVQIASNSAPSPLLWDSASSSNKNDTGVVTVSTVANTTTAPASLVAGANVLSFQLLNSDGSGSEVDNVCLRPVLEVDLPTGFATGYLTTATLGSANTAVTTAIPPDISQVTEDPPQPVGGVGSPDLVISARVTKTLSNLHATTPVILKWRRMYDVETSVTMLDDGLNGDVLPGDSIFTARIPTTSLTAGQMVRWRVEAKDTASQFGFSPPYNFASNATQTNPVPDATTELEQYYGTIANPNITGSTLPDLHWFFTGTDNTGNATGTRCSFYFKPLPKDNPEVGYIQPKGRFYDNVLVNIHGQSTSGFAKKSHDMSFSKDKKFRWKDGEPDSSGTNILSNFADKTKVRNTVAWESFEHSNHIASHYCQILRVHQNASFKGLYDLVENANEAFLRREKLDDVTGALYKVYNRLESATITTGNNSVEKKNPDDGNSADLAAFVTGIASSNAMTDRLRFFYDNADIASAINWLATQSITINRDFGHKNYYVYRDTAGTGEWSMLPWDQDLSLGHTWTGTGGGYFNDDIHSQAPLQIGVLDNRVIQIVYGTPELNALFVRRLRSLADGFYGSPTETNSILTQRINQLLNQIDPNPNNPAAGTDDADLDMRAWGYWLDGAGTVVPYTSGTVLDHTVRAQGARITNANPVPPYPGTAAPYVDWGDGSTSLLPFVTGRRDFYFNPTAPMSGTMPLPSSQVASPTLVIEQINVNPSTGLPAVFPAGANHQSFEYFVIRNTSNTAVDVSGWKVDGDVRIVFRGGTVIPAQSATTTQATNAAYVNQLIVANRPSAFRQRTASPKGNEYRFVTGPYDRQLSARGGTITLHKPIDPMNLAAGYTLYATQTYTGTATSHQNFLRVSELNFRPAPATPAELLAVPGLLPNDFEFIELINDGPTTLDLGSAKFEEGIEFTFPAGFTLASGARCLVVASETAFETRYGTGLPIAGEFQGNLDNGGERLRIEDPVGEEVLDFTYDDDWFPVPVGQYRSFVTRTTAPAYDDYADPTTWALSDAQNGTPNGGDTSNSRVFEGWRWDHFTLAEIPTLLTPNTPGALTADPDGDGMNNFSEFAFGRNPRLADHPGALTVGGRTTDAGSDYLCVTFRRAKNALDITYNIEANSDLANAAGWTNVGVLVTATDLGNGIEEVCYRDNTPMGATPRYMRVRAAKP